MAGWIILFIFISIAFVLLKAIVLPTLFLTVGYGNLPEVYAPEESVKKYIEDYSVSKEKGNKFYICSLAEGAVDFAYDIIVYDRTGCVCKVIGATSDTRRVQLPAYASKVRLALTSEGGEKIKNERANRCGAAEFAAYFICCTIVAFLFALGTAQCAVRVLGRSDYLNVGITLIATAVVTVSDIIFTAVYIRRGGGFKKFRASLPVWLFTAFAFIFITVCSAVPSSPVSGNESNYFEKDGVVYAWGGNNRGDDCAVYVTSISRTTAVIPEYVGKHRVARILVLDCTVRELTINIDGDADIISGAFSKCRKLTKVTMNGVKIVPDEAFYGCQALETVEMRNVSSIGYRAFYGCANLTTVIMNRSAEVDASAFLGCPNLRFQN